MAIVRRSQGGGSLGCGIRRDRAHYQTRSPPSGNRGGATSGFRPDIEGFRAIAVGVVVAFHAGVPAIGGGYVGVDVFYVISGFLITGLLERELRASGTIQFARFYLRRALRLLPMALLVLVAIAGGMLIFTPPVYRPAVRLDEVSAMFYYANWQFALESVNYLGARRRREPGAALLVAGGRGAVLPGLAAPARCSPCGSRRRRRGAGCEHAAVAACMLAVAGRRVARVVDRPHGRVSRPIGVLRDARPGPGSSRSAGAVAPRRWPALARRPVARVRSRRPAGMAAVLVCRRSPSTARRPSSPGAAALAPGARRRGGDRRRHGRCRRRRRRACSSLRPLRYVGRISYSWYLWHWPCLVFARTSRGGAASDGRHRLRWRRATRRGDLVRARRRRPTRWSKRAARRARLVGR